MPLATPVRGVAVTRPIRQTRRLALTGLLAAAVLTIMPGAASAATPYGTNLVRNPGAENGLTSWVQSADPGTRT